MSNNKLKGVHRLSKYIKKSNIIFFVCFSFLVSGLNLFPIQILSTLVDKLSGSDYNRIEKMILAFTNQNMVLVVLFGVFYFLAGLMANEYGYRIVNYNNSIIEAVRKDIFSSAIYEEELSKNSADMITRAISDVEQITRVVAGPLNGFLQKVMSFFISVIILCVWNYKIAIFTLLSSIVLYVLSVDISKKNKENGELERKEIARLSVKFSDVIKNLELIRSYQTDENELKHLDEESNQIFEVRKNISNKMKWYWSAISLIDGITYLLIFSLLLYEIESGRNSIGEILAIYVYVENAFSAMISISRYKTEIYNSDAALSRAFDVITPFISKEKKEKTMEISEVETLTVKNMKLSYDDKTVLKGINIEANQGRLTIIKGESGCGKSSLLNVLVGNRKMDDGKILFDGEDVTANSGKRRNAIRLCFQEPMLFCNTLQYNLKYDSNELDNDLNVKGRLLIDRLVAERGEKFMLDDKVSNLSGGEKKRIAIARTMNKKVPIYLFDEPTAELDEENRRRVINLLNELKKEHIVIVSTHDEELIYQGDKVYDLSNA